MIPQTVLDFFHAGKSLPFRSMTVFNFLLEATLAGSVLILVMMVLRLVFRKRIGSRMVYIAWALVAIRLLVPVALPNPLMNDLRPTYSTDAQARPVADQIRIRYQDAMADVAYQLSQSAAETGSVFQESLSTVAHELDAYTSYGWLGKAYLLCYAAGALITALVFVARHLRFRRRLRESVVGTLKGAQMALYQSLCEGLKIRPIPVWYVDPLTSPCLVGVAKPMIALPLTLPPDSLGEALQHELAHYRARDAWWVLLRSVCCVVHWFNPLVWFAQRLVKTDCELACDERVALRLTPEQRTHYANTLIHTAKRPYSPRTGVLTTGMTMTGKRLMRRVYAILHIKSVQRIAAALVAIVLVVLSVAAFSTAETKDQTARLTTDSSAFPFQTNDPYPALDKPFTQAVPLTPLTNASEAVAQAKRYLCAMYPEDQPAIQSQYRFFSQQLGKYSWEVVVWPPEGGETSLYYMELLSAGGLVSVNRSDAFSNGDEKENHPSILPKNLTDVLLIYTQRLSGAVLQNVKVDKASIHGDMETAEGRYVVCDLTNTADPSVMVSLTVQIAPSFRLIGVYNAANNCVIDTQANPVIGQSAQRLAYGMDASIAFDATFWGDADSQYILSPDAILTVQQAFDIAVSTMLTQSGLSREAFLSLPLEYGYYDKSYFGGEASVWRFVWYVNKEESMNRYWVEFSDQAAPTDVLLSPPGVGLG